MSKFKLIIFDCEGVLVDTEPTSNQIMADLVSEIGYSCTLEKAKYLFLGRSMSNCLEVIRQRLNIEPPEDFLDRYHAKLYECLEKNVEAIPGIEGALKEITIAKCVASSGSHEKMAITLGNTGLDKYFGRNIFSSLQVEKGKPNPDLFLFAANEMDVVPEDCLVIEDSTLGVLAAKRANMSVFGYSRAVNPKKLEEMGGDLVFDDMADLPSLIP